MELYLHLKWPPPSHNQTSKQHLASISDHSGSPPAGLFTSCCTRCSVLAGSWSWYCEPHRPSSTTQTLHHNMAGQHWNRGECVFFKMSIAKRGWMILIATILLEITDWYNKTWHITSKISMIPWQVKQIYTKTMVVA